MIKLAVIIAITNLPLSTIMKCFMYHMVCVATLALGSQPRQRACKVASQEGSSGVTLHALGSVKSVREWTFKLPMQLPFWEMESQWTPESSEGNFRGQNSMDWRVLYIIENILERRCLKWARIAHLDIWNTRYGQKKGQESNWQFDSQPLKNGNWPIFLCVGGVGHIVGTRARTLLQTSL
jgi:hypothetical protein